MKNKQPLKHAANTSAWAIGHQQRNGFHVRKVVWGILMARAEKRDGEEIRAAEIMVGPSRRRKERSVASSETAE